MPEKPSDKSVLAKIFLSTKLVDDAEAAKTVFDMFCLKTYNEGIDGYIRNISAKGVVKEKLFLIHTNYATHWID